MQIDKPALHDKAWGREEWVVNTPDYCGKRLILNAGWQCSLHMHKIKDETFFVASGIVEMILGDERSYLNAGESVHIPPGAYHRFRGITDAVLYEFSTHHEESDSYRLEESRYV